MTFFKFPRIVMREKTDPKCLHLHTKILDDLLNTNNTKVTNVNTMDSSHTTYRAFYYATNQQSAQAIAKNAYEINLTQYKHSLDFGSDPSFYSNPSIDNAIECIKYRKGFNGIVVYWVDIEKLES